MRCLEILRTDLGRDMKMLGAPRLSTIDASVVRADPPLAVPTHLPLACDLLGT